MNLLCITDLHGDQAALEHILDKAGGADVILLGGDLTNFGTPNEAEAAVRRAAVTGAKVLAVAGNCDSRRIDERLASLGASLFRRGTVLDGVGFYGVSAMPPWMGNMYELSEDEIAAALEEGRRQLRGHTPEVVLSHPPPRDTPLDVTARGSHVGSTAVREQILAAQPALVVCGHIHEGRGIARLGATTIVNCGPAFRGCFALARLEGDSPVDVELVG